MIPTSTDSYEYTNKLKENKIIMSMSEKGHPWKNGFQESFYSQFKLAIPCGLCHRVTIKESLKTIGFHIIL